MQEAKAEFQDQNNEIRGYFPKKLCCCVGWEVETNIQQIWKVNVNIWSIYFELRMKDQIEERSSQFLHNLSSCENKEI